MLSFWYTIGMLGFESNSVIRKRCSKIGRGGWQSLDEVGLMFEEKARAGFEAGTSMMTGTTANGVIDRFRVLVAANEIRLSSGR